MLIRSVLAAMKYLSLIAVIILGPLAYISINEKYEKELKEMQVKRAEAIRRHREVVHAGNRIENIRLFPLSRSGSAQKKDAEVEPNAPPAITIPLLTIPPAGLVPRKLATPLPVAGS